MFSLAPHKPSPISAVSKNNSVTLYCSLLPMQPMSCFHAVLLFTTGRHCVSPTIIVVEQKRHCQHYIIKKIKQETQRNKITFFQHNLSYTFSKLNAEKNLV